MAGRYARFYNRRGSSRGSRQPTQASILFDNIVEVGNNKRPTAAKSAGTVGRVCLRSREDSPAAAPTNKRMRVEYPSQPIPTSGQDPFSFGGQESVNQPKPAAKPRKFFKSRGAEAAQKESEIRLQASVYMNNEQCSTYVARGSTEVQYPSRKQQQQQQYPTPEKSKSSKFFSGRHKQTENSKVNAELSIPVTYTTRQSSAPPLPLLSDTSLQAEVKPPIRLRIFKNKGTSHLMSETQVLSSEDCEDSSVDLPQSNDTNEPIMVGDTYYSSQALSPEKNSESADSADDTVEMKPELSESPHCVNSLVESQILIPSDDQSNAPNGNNMVPSQMEEETNEEQDSAEAQAVAEADNEKLLKAEELLADTYVDFTSTSKLLLDPKEILPTSSKTPLVNDWYSENEDSSNETPEPEQIDPTETSQPLSSQEEPEICSAPCSQIVSEDGSQPIEEQSLSQPEFVDREFSPQKKGSIFKSRRLLTGGAKKRLALYKHKWSDDKEEKEKAANAASTSQAASASAAPSNVFDEDFHEPEMLTRVKRPAETAMLDPSEEPESITGVLCNRATRKYYTVVRDVKNAHQMQETGEFYVFNDDVDYILDALADNNPIATRCLSAISLATKCMAPAFRMHVRAHGIVAKFFTALHDATLDPSLALCTATVMFVMSQDQLNMDLDRGSLELMLNLLDTDASHHNALDTLVEQGISGSQLDKNKRKVGNLAMESLLSLTSRRAGEWFKEELRQLGGLEHIVKTVSVCCQALNSRHSGIWDEAYLAKLKKVDRCLRVLYNLISKNLENQLYLLTYEGGYVMDLMLQLMQLCTFEVSINPITDPSDKEGLAMTLREALLSTMKFLVDLTHNSDGKALGSKMLGTKPGVVDACLYCVMRMPNYFTEEKQFDIMVVGLCLLINLAECPPSNRKLIIEARAPPDESDIIFSSQSAVDALIDLFIKNEVIAKIEEGHTDAILDSKKEEIIPKEEQATKTPDEIFNDIVEKLLQKAGKNMECNLIQAYIAMLFGYVIMDNKEYEGIIREKLPEKNFQSMLKVLKKFVNFMVLTISTVSKSRSILDTERLIEYLKMVDHDYIKEEALDMSC
ncbi:hypothetical protein B566_EDAN004469 [Ephemera danica]|nr:hypothetical protein B566_EDAN004469 [Ephemera danica]